MKISQLFLDRYEPLSTFWLASIWEVVPPELLRVRPHPQVNSIAWNLWHLARVEDAGANRFVTDGVQVFDAGDWGRRMNLPWRHNGGEMTFAEVDELSQRIGLPALRGYGEAVAAGTRAVAAQLDWLDLEAVMEEAPLRRILFEEGLAYRNPDGLLQNYLGWSKGKCLMNFCLTHAYQHVGEIGVIAGLLGVTFD